MPSIIVHDKLFTFVHGHAPEQCGRAGDTAHIWSFRLDSWKDAVKVRATYADALKQAKMLAKASVFVLP